METSGQAHLVVAAVDPDSQSDARTQLELLKRLLRKHGYPPDKREEALVTVIEQAEVVCKDWASAA